MGRKSERRDPDGRASVRYALAEMFTTHSSIRMSHLAEETLRSEQLVDGKLLKVYRDEVRLADGREAVREWVDHPGASAVVPLFEDGTTLLVRQYRYPPRRTFLEVPAGKIDVAGESPGEVAARELEEETGWKAGVLTGMGSLFPCIGYSNEVIHLFLAEGLEPGRRDLSGGEAMDVESLPFDQALDLVRSGGIVDMKSVVALLYAEALLERRR